MNPERTDGVELDGLLDGLEGEDREARQRLLQRLRDDGVGAEELRTAVAENRLALLPVERVLGGNLTAADVEDATGLAARDVLRLRDNLGLPSAEPDDPVFSDADVAAAEAIKAFRAAGFSEETSDQIAFVLGEGMSRLAATITAAAGETFLRPGDSEEDVAMRFTALAEDLVPTVSPVLVAAFRSHLHDIIRRGMLGAEERESGQIAGVQDLAVCFADLVGFTRLGGQLEVQELGTVVGRLSALANRAAQDPVRLVKTIGDAAMFVSPDPAAMVGAALWLVEAAADEDLPALRAGVSFGRAQQRTGDFFGHAVNLASRVTGIARPASVLCTQEVHDAAEAQFEWSFAGKHRVKGIKEPQPLFRARRSEPETQAAAAAEGKSAKKRPADRRRTRASS